MRPRPDQLTFKALFWTLDLSPIREYASSGSTIGFFFFDFGGKTRKLCFGPWSLAQSENMPHLVQQLAPFSSILVAKREAWLHLDRTICRFPVVHQVTPCLSCFVYWTGTLIDRGSGTGRHVDETDSPSAMRLAGNGTSRSRRVRRSKAGHVHSDVCPEMASFIRCSCESILSFRIHFRKALQ